jgi:ATP-dependent DNA helicase PIF1
MKDFDDPDYRVPTEFLHSLTPANTPPHELRLKVGTVVMILRNLDAESGLQNGTRIQINKLKEFAIEGTIITEGPFFNKKCIIPRIKFVIDDPTLFGFTFTRIQFPVNIAFAMTIHKSEGQTLQQVGLYLPDPVFTHGMLYTALSRSTTRKGVTVLLGVNQRPPDKHEGWYTANVVFRSVLSD